MMKQMCVVIVVLLTLLIGSTPVFAQISLTVVLRDIQGTPMEAVRVSLHQADGMQLAEAVTDIQGQVTLSAPTDAPVYVRVTPTSQTRGPVGLAPEEQQGIRYQLKPGGRTVLELRADQNGIVAPDPMMWVREGSAQTPLPVATITQATLATALPVNRQPLPTVAPAETAVTVMADSTVMQEDTNETTSMQLILWAVLIVLSFSLAILVWLKRKVTP